MERFVSKPVVTSQRYRVIQILKSRLAEAGGEDPEKFFVVFNPRVCQVVGLDVGENAFNKKWLWGLEADAAIFKDLHQPCVEGQLSLVVFLDRDRQNYSPLLGVFESGDVPALFISERQVLNGEFELPCKTTDAERTNSAPTKKPFNWSETKILRSIAAGLTRNHSGIEVLMTGQTSLSSFTEFTGFSGSQYQSDCDILICSPPPVSFPLLGIEVDGPSHFCKDFWTAEKNGNERAAELELERQTAKLDEKNRAFEKAEIPLLRLRVDRRTRNTFDEFLDLIAHLVAKVVAYLADEGVIKRKKYDYLREMASVFRVHTGCFHSEAPGLEDLAHLAPELFDHLIDRFFQLESELNRRLESEQREYELMSNSVDPKWEEIERQWIKTRLFDAEVSEIQGVPPDQLFNYLSFEIQFSPSARGSLRLFNEKIVFRSRFAEKRILKSIANRRAIPWMEVCGHLKSDLAYLVERETGHYLAEKYFQELSPEDKAEWKRKLVEYLVWQKDIFSNEQRLQEVQKAYQAAGVQALKDRLDSRLKYRIQDILERRGFIARKVARTKMHGIFPAKYQWIHKDIGRPSVWSAEGEHGQSIDLDKLLKLCVDVDPLTQKDIENEFDVACEMEFVIFRKVGVECSDFEYAKDHSRVLKARMKSALDK